MASPLLAVRKHPASSSGKRAGPGLTLSETTPCNACYQHCTETIPCKENQRPTTARTERVPNAYRLRTPKGTEWLQNGNTFTLFRPSHARSQPRFEPDRVIAPWKLLERVLPCGIGEHTKRALNAALGRSYGVTFGQSLGRHPVGCGKPAEKA